MRRTLLASSLFALALLCSRGAVATEALPNGLPFTLTWQAPASCPTGSDIENELKHLAAPRAGARLEPLVASGVIEQKSGQFVLQLSTETRGEHGTTVLRATRCAELQRAATLVLALVFGDAVELRDASASSSLPEPQASASPPAVARRRSTLQGSSFSVHPEAGAQLSFGLTPRVAYGPRVGVSLRREAMWLRTSIGAAFSVATPLSSRVDVDFWSGAWSAGACYAPARRPIAVGGCLGAVAGFIAGSAHGATDNGSALAPWYAVAPSLLLALGGKSLTVTGEAGIALVPRPPRFEVRGAGSFDSRHVVPFFAVVAAL